MNMSCSSRTIKYLMFAFNLFFVISGIIVIAVGATVKTVYSDYSDFLDSKYFTLPNMLIATGTLIFVISFFGCCGAIKESWIMLGIFAIFLGMIFIFEFSAGIAGYVLRDRTINYLDETLRANMKNYEYSNRTWDLIQRNFECCGVDGYSDWNGTFKDKPDYFLPMSCCPTLGGQIGVSYCNSLPPTSDPTTTTTTGTTTISTTTTTSTTISPPSSESTTPTTAQTTTVSTTTHDTSETSSPSSSPTPAPPARRRRSLGGEGALNAATNNDTTTPSPSTLPPYQTGCKTAFGNYIKKHAVQIGGWAIGLAVIQLLGIVFSCHLVRQVKNGYYST